MLFFLSLDYQQERVILDQDWYGEVLAIVEGRDWKEAREAAIPSPVMDEFEYCSGCGWELRDYAIGSADIKRESLSASRGVKSSGSVIVIGSSPRRSTKLCSITPSLTSSSPSSIS